MAITSVSIHLDIITPGQHSPILEVREQHRDRAGIDWIPETYYTVRVGPEAMVYLNEGQALELMQKLAAALQATVTHTANPYLEGAPGDPGQPLPDPGDVEAVNDAAERSDVALLSIADRIVNAGVATCQELTDWCEQNNVQYPHSEWDEALVVFKWYEFRDGSRLRFTGEEPRYTPVVVTGFDDEWREDMAAAEAFNRG